MEGFLIDVGATTQHVLSSLIVSFKKKRNHNLCTQYIVEALRMLTSTIWNSEKYFWNQSTEHV